MNESDSQMALWQEFHSREYRRTYAEEFLNTWISAQVQVLRTQRGWTQAELAERCGTKQPGIARLENANFSKSSIDLLCRVASAFDTSLRVSFETFGTLLRDAHSFGRQSLERPPFEEDEEFRAQVNNECEIKETPLEMMRKQFGEWLASGTPPTKLLEWLSGSALPAVGGEEDPFVWILRGLPVGKTRLSARRSVATRLSEMFTGARRLELARQDEIFYNALQLAGGIAIGEVLESPLLQLFDDTASEILTAEVRRAFTSALIRNQHSPRLRNDWIRLVREGSHERLSGNEFTGCAGIFRTPRQTGPIEEVGADWDAIGQALAIMSHRLENGSDRHQVFSRLIDILAEVRGDDEGFRKQVLVQSFDASWPNWAKGLVPSLWVFDETRDGVKWHLLSIPPYLFRVSWNEVTKSGRIEKLRVPTSPVRLVEAIFQRSLLDVPGSAPRFRHVGENLLHNLIRMEIQQLALIGRQDIPDSPELPEIWTKTQDHMSITLKSQMMAAGA